MAAVTRFLVSARLIGDEVDHFGARSYLRVCLVYVFAKTYKRDQDKKNAQAAAAAAASAKLPSLLGETPAAADPIPAPPPKRVPPPVSGEEQRQLYKWMLEELRKVKPQDAAEKKKINEEKALLKEVIRAESLPRL